MWFNFWTGGFLAGWLLARTVPFSFLSWSLLAFLLALLLLRRVRRNAWLWGVVGFCFSSYHSAPFPAHALSERLENKSELESERYNEPRSKKLAELGSGKETHEQSEMHLARSAQHNQLQFFYSDLIATTAAQERWRVRGYPHSYGRVNNVGGKQRYFIFTRPPQLHERTMVSPPPLVSAPRLYLLRQTDHLREPVRSWIASITLGKRKGMPSTLRDAFRLLGLFHILVISGLHISIIATGGKKLIDLALRSLYIVRLLTPTTWLVLSKLISLLSCLLILFYGCLVGFSAPAQRAVLLFVTHQGYALWERNAILAEKIKLVLFLQMLLFPIGFLSDSLLLSWGAYLIVLHCFQEIKQARSLGGKLAALLRTQLVITALILCFFTELSILSLPLNILLLPLIPYLVMSGFLLLLLPAHTALAVWIEHSHLFFLQQVAHLAEITSTYSWLTINISHSPPLRVALFVVLIIMVLSRSAFVTKRDMEQEQEVTVE